VHDVSGVVVADLDVPALGDPCLAAIRDRAGILERFLVRRVVRLLGVERPVDHPVTTLRGLAPRPRRRVGLVPSG